jgi:hypothetical protein
MMPLALSNGSGGGPVTVTVPLSGRDGHRDAATASATQVLTRPCVRTCQCHCQSATGSLSEIRFIKCHQCTLVSAVYSFAKLSPLSTTQAAGPCALSAQLSALGVAGGGRGTFGGMQNSTLVCVHLRDGERPLLSGEPRRRRGSPRTKIREKARAD